MIRTNRPVAGLAAGAWFVPAHGFRFLIFEKASSNQAERNESTMKTTLRFMDLNIHNSWHRMLEQHVDHWQRLTAVTATEVVMERQRDGRPAFRVQVRLEVPGGTLRAEAIARTLKAALVEATQGLERQIQDRQTQRMERRASERQLSAVSSPSNR